MSFHFIFGGSGSGKSTAIREVLIKRSMAEPRRQFFLIVPDQFTMSSQKEMVEAHPKKTIMNIDVQSFSRLCYRIFEEVGQKELLAIDDTGKNLVLRKVASSLYEEGKIPVLGSSMKRIGCLHEVKSVLSEFMQYGMGIKDIEKIQEYSKGRQALSEKLADLRTVYGAFLETLSEKYVTTEEKLALLAGAVSKSELLRDAVVYFDGFTGFTPVQRQVIGALFQQCSEVNFSLNMSEDAADELLRGGVTKETDLFYLTKKSYESILKLAAECKCKREQDVILRGDSVKRYEKNAPMAFMEKNLFRTSHKAYQGKPENIHLSVLPTPREEVNHLCREIRHLVKEKGYAYRDIAVVTGDISRYRMAAEERFAMYEIPLFVDQGVGVTRNPFMEYILSGMDVILSDFSFDSIMRFLRSGLSGLARDEVDVFSVYLRSRNIRGKKKWADTFTQGFAGDVARMMQMNQYRERLLEVFAPLLEIPFSRRSEKKEDAAIITEKVYAFIERSELEQKLRNQAKIFEEQQDFTRAKEYEQIYGYIMEVLSQIHELLAGEAMTLVAYKEMIEAGASEMEIGLLPRTVDYVLFGDIERTRLRNIKALFFLGVNDGIIPRNVSGTGLLSDMEREFFREGGFEFSPSPREQMIQQRLYLYMNLCTPSEQLYISYSAADMEGKEERPSYLVEMLEKMFPEMKKQKPMQRPVVETVVSEVDARECFAKLISEYANGILESSVRKEEKQLLVGLYQMKKDVYKELVDSAFFSYHPVPLAKEIIRTLYGSKLSVSISRLEGYAACAYRHFLKYALNLSPEEDSRFAVQDLGNFFHGILEKFGQRLENEGIEWAGITEAAAKDILHEIVEQEAISYREKFLYEDAATMYQIQRMERILLRTVESVGYQLAKGSIRKMQFEVQMKRALDIKELEDTIVNLTGKIDRMDTAEQDGKIYVRIVDYKSGNNKIDLLKVYEGQQLQLAVYMDEALKMEKDRNPEKEVLPAGMFYYHVQDPFMEGTDESAYTAWLHKQMRLSGLIPEDEQVYTLLDKSLETERESDVVHLSVKTDGTLAKKSQTPKDTTFIEVLQKASEQCERHIKGILEGEKTASPYDGNTCSYCDYKDVCGFDTRIKGYKRQK